MTAAEWIQLLFGLHHPDRVEKCRTVYAALEPYVLETDYAWQAAMNEPAEEGIIQSGVYLVWAQDTVNGLLFWDTASQRYLIPATFTWSAG